jgi:hypothetical protein
MRVISSWARGRTSSLTSVMKGAARAATIAASEDRALKVVERHIRTQGTFQFLDLDGGAGNRSSDVKVHHCFARIEEFLRPFVASFGHDGIRVVDLEDDQFSKIGLPAPNCGLLLGRQIAGPARIQGEFIDELLLRPAARRFELGDVRRVVGEDEQNIVVDGEIHVRAVGVGGAEMRLIARARQKFRRAEFVFDGPRSCG